VITLPLEAHRLIATSIVTYYALVGLWGIVLGFMKRPVDGQYRAALFIGIGVAVVQVLIGIVLLLLGGTMKNDLHFLYGLSLIVRLPLARQLSVGRGWRQPLVYGLTCLFMSGLATRGITTA